MPVVYFGTFVHLPSITVIPSQQSGAVGHTKHFLGMPCWGKQPPVLQPPVLCSAAHADTIPLPPRIRVCGPEYSSPTPLRARSFPCPSLTVLALPSHAQAQPVQAPHTVLLQSSLQLPAIKSGPTLVAQAAVQHPVHPGPLVTLKVLFQLASYWHRGPLYGIRTTAVLGSTYGPGSRVQLQ